MAEELKSLIEKIQEEGVKVAKEKASNIENEARRQAQAILEKARQEAQKLIADAQEKVAKEEEAGRLALKQAGRDSIISLRKEITATLDRVIAAAIKDALEPEELVKIISRLIQEQGQRHREGIIISLNKEDAQRLEKDFLDALKEELKKGITLKISEDIQAGFLISFDAGRSLFDFTDKALADYLGSYVKPKLGEMLNSCQLIIPIL